ncbi:uncharacterized protein BCR38DRAFT_340942 [Pseudomassariella vexata]|uniref:MARVEL domain-containing protein n=1 Tax=Pseudomassariella vexata TaxID=1141098 RepID=A0A1Y2E0V3_9PEZI|nr:uncharacterized protein BCR38DRAFT_340942 [Pseudomassariella vexata]ORY65183.1 hypothetical protein BCR38DRAFT_340942 [Pseudomassariella vexata]
MGAQGLTGRGPAPVPSWLIFVKDAIILLSVIILALSAYAISLYGSYYSYYYSSGVPGYLIFLVIKTWIIYGIAIALELKAQNYFFRIVVLIAYVLSVIFWLSGWAWSASWAATILSYTAYEVDGVYKTFGSVMAACAGLGAILWILTIVNLVFFIMACLQNQDSAQNVELDQPVKQDQTQVSPEQQQYTQPGYPQQQPSQPQQAYP